MSLHDRIMSLATGKDCPDELPARMLYKQGHRDARHAAAELSIEADQLMEEMADLIDRMAGLFSELDLGYEVECRALNTKYYNWKDREK